MCSRCHKRVAVVFIQNTQNGNTKPEGFCVKCAKELGIKPLEDLIAQTGFDDETIERFNDEMEALIQSGDINPTDDASRTPIINFAKLMGEGENKNEKKDKKSAKDKKDGEPEYKYLNGYRSNLWFTILENLPVTVKS